MKTTTILILAILLAVSLSYNKAQADRNAELERDLNGVRKSYLKHLNKCAFISRDQIQSIRFQFQYGSIKRLKAARMNLSLKLFQFQYGSIKSLSLFEPENTI